MRCRQRNWFVTISRPRQRKLGHHPVEVNKSAKSMRSAWPFCGARHPVTTRTARTETAIGFAVPGAPLTRSRAFQFCPVAHNRCHHGCGRSSGLRPAFLSTLARSHPVRSASVTASASWRRAEVGEISGRRRACVGRSVPRMVDDVAGLESFPDPASAGRPGPREKSRPSSARADESGSPASDRREGIGKIRWFIIGIPAARPPWDYRRARTRRADAVRRAISGGPAHGSHHPMFHTYSVNTARISSRLTCWSNIAL